ncbi:MAG TPA: hypothetical protein VGC08_00050 [Pedobacter sp.]
MCFFIDPGYRENDLGNQAHRTKALCWIGFHESLKRLILLTGNINECIAEEIKKFHTDYEDVMIELAQIGGPQEVALMIREVEEFIRETISNTYD